MGKVIAINSVQKSSKLELTAGRNSCGREFLRGAAAAAADGRTDGPEDGRTGVRTWQRAICLSADGGPPLKNKKVETSNGRNIARIAPFWTIFGQN